MNITLYIENYAPGAKNAQGQIFYIDLYRQNMLKSSSPKYTIQIQKKFIS